MPPEPGPKKARPAGKARRPPEADRYTISDLDQMKALADPLRVRMLEAFCRGEMTTRQVAEEIGEKATKLYHHVDALRRAGLIRVARTRRNRGTLEKFFIAVAKSYTADARLFAAAEKDPARAAGPLGKMVSTVFENTSSELRRLIDGAHAREGIEEEGIISYCELHAGEKEVRKVRDRLKKILASVQESCAAAGAPKDARRYRLTIAFFPLDLDQKKARKKS